MHVYITFNTFGFFIISPQPSQENETMMYEGVRCALNQSNDKKESNEKSPKRNIDEHFRFGSFYSSQNNKEQQQQTTTLALKHAMTQ